MKNVISAHHQSFQKGSTCGLSGNDGKSKFCAEESVSLLSRATQHGRICAKWSRQRLPGGHKYPHRSSPILLMYIKLMQPLCDRSHWAWDPCVYEEITCAKVGTTSPVISKQTSSFEWLAGGGVNWFRHASCRPRGEMNRL